MHILTNGHLGLSKSLKFIIIIYEWLTSGSLEGILVFHMHNRKVLYTHTAGKL